MKLVILRRKLKKVRQHPQEEQQQQTSFKDLLENSRSKIELLMGHPVHIKEVSKLFYIAYGTTLK